MAIVAAGIRLLGLVQILSQRDSCRRSGSDKIVKECTGYKAIPQTDRDDTEKLAEPNYKD